MEDIRIELLEGDITKLNVDAIVNAANKHLKGGGGVDGAIHRAAGPMLLNKCKEIISIQKEIPTANVVLTDGFNLVAKYIIHTVGPIWYGGKNNEPELLAQTYRNILQLSYDKRFNTIAIPNISTGIYGFPKELASEIALQECFKFINKNDYPKKIIFVCYDSQNYELYKIILEDDSFI